VKISVKQSVEKATRGRFRWVVLAFVFYGLINAALLIWQLLETSPVKWCAVADINDVSAAGCFSVLLKLLEIKDHTVIGLLAILGITAGAVMVVTLRVNMDIEGPGGLKAKVNPEETTIEDTAGTSSVTVPTPPSESEDEVA
jgi:hypothetical protein